MPLTSFLFYRLVFRLQNKVTSAAAKLYCSNNLKQGYIFATVIATSDNRMHHFPNKCPVQVILLCRFHSHSIILTHFVYFLRMIMSEITLTVQGSIAAAKFDSF